MLALGQPGQAYLLLMQSAEVALKGIVEDVLRSGISDVGRRNQKLLRTTAEGNPDLSDGVLNDLLGHGGGFKKCFEFVSKNLGIGDAFDNCYIELYQTRNRCYSTSFMPSNRSGCCANHTAS